MFHHCALGLFHLCPLSHHGSLMIFGGPLCSWYNVSSLIASVLFVATIIIAESLEGMPGMFDDFQELRSLKTFAPIVSHKSVPQECPTRVSHKSVPQECPARVSQMSVPQERPTTWSRNSVPQECLTRVSLKSVPQECPATVYFMGGWVGGRVKNKLGMALAIGLPSVAHGLPLHTDRESC